MLNLKTIISTQYFSMKKYYKVQLVCKVNHYMLKSGTINPAAGLTQKWNPTETSSTNHYYNTARIITLSLRNTLKLSLYLYQNERLLINLLGQLPFPQFIGSFYGYPENIFKPKLNVSKR